MPISGCSRPAKPSSTPSAKDPICGTTTGCSKSPTLPALVDDGAVDLTNTAIYKKCPDDVKSAIQSKAFTKKEREDVEEVLGKMGALMTCENHPVKRIGRTDQAITSCVAEQDTMGEWFQDRGALVMTDNATANFHLGGGRKEFKGSLAHELTHGLTNSFDPRTCTAYSNPRDNPLMQEWVKLMGWDDTWKKVADPSSLPSDYAKTNAKEDLSETVKFYLYAPDELKKKSPERYEFAKKLLGGA